jgi:hypothetical protein
MRLERRLALLEKTTPKQSPYAHLTNEELKAEMFEVSRKLHAQGLPISEDTFLWVPESRQFADEASWIKDRNHRLDVFLKFMQIIYQLDLPNHARIASLLGQGWMDYPIEKADRDWLAAELVGVDLGEEGPWLEDYLEHSGSKEMQ